MAKIRIILLNTKYLVSKKIKKETAWSLFDFTTKAIRYNSSQLGALCLTHFRPDTSPSQLVLCAELYAVWVIVVCTALYDVCCFQG